MTDAAFTSAARGTVRGDGDPAPGPAARGRLEETVRGQVRRAWRMGIAYAAGDRLDDPSLAAYPEEAGAVAVIMAAADAYAGGEDGGAEDGARFLTAAEVAAAARVTRPTVYRAVRSGELGAVRVGRAYRVREEDARRWLGGGEERTPDA